mmetsp:Transcript_68884/g.165344  ORF Transcript_68884/g.165344 Transcript_68884/m.165344 type:complete len:298 (-) Transcript_68884:58-951(-)
MGCASSDAAGASSGTPPVVLQEFTVAVRRMEGEALGLDLKPDIPSRTLVVIGLGPNGLLSAWEGESSIGRIEYGDRIVAVNSHRGDCRHMLRALAKQDVLNIKVRRYLPASTAVVPRTKQTRTPSSSKDTTHFSEVVYSSSQSRIGSTPSASKSTAMRSGTSTASGTRTLGTNPSNLSLRSVLTSGTNTTTASASSRSVSFAGVEHMEEVQRDHALQFGLGPTHTFRGKDNKMLPFDQSWGTTTTGGYGSAAENNSSCCSPTTESPASRGSPQRFSPLGNTPTGSSPRLPADGKSSL